jgi:hypothetical protein
MNRQPINFAGIVLVVVGVLLLIVNFTTITIARIWPGFIILPGLLFLTQFIQDRSQYGLLMPFAILTTIGGLFLYCTFFGWHLMSELWPIFIAAPGFGFLLMYFFGKRDPGLIIPATILLAVAAIFSMLTAGPGIFWAAVLIISGLLILLGRTR